MTERTTPSVPSPPAPARAPTGTIVVGGLLVVVGTGWLLDEAGVTELVWDALLPAALILIGIVVATEALRGRSHGGLRAIGIALTIVLALDATLSIPFAAGIGERVERPTSIDALDPAYELGVGKLEVDLTGIDVVDRDASLVVRVGVGEVQIVVDEDVPVEIAVRSSIGETVLFGRQDGGFGVDSTYRTPDHPGPVLRLEASAGIGKVEVRNG
jgi:hypothetical protein